jgi:hypothetical protein
MKSTVAQLKLCTLEFARSASEGDSGVKPGHLTCTRDQLVKLYCSIHLYQYCLNVVALERKVEISYRFFFNIRTEDPGRSILGNCSFNWVFVSVHEYVRLKVFGYRLAFAGIAMYPFKM